MKHGVEVQELTPGMFGSASAACFKLKVGEHTKLLPYDRFMIVKHTRTLPEPVAMLQCCDSLLLCNAFITKYPTTFPVEAVQDHAPKVLLMSFDGT